MFQKKQDEIARRLDKAIIDLYESMETFVGDDEEYDKMTNQLEKLHQLRDKSRREKVNPNTALIVVGNLGGILMILGYERAHLMTSKAMSFIRPPN